MSFMLFGEYLIKNTDGKITAMDIYDALIEQKHFSENYKRLGEILVDKNKLTEEELDKYLDNFTKMRNNKIKTGII